MERVQCGWNKRVAAVIFCIGHVHTPMQYCQHSSVTWSSCRPYSDGRVYPTSRNQAPCAPTSEILCGGVAAVTGTQRQACVSDKTQKKGSMSEAFAGW
jgi:hypothetical protein